jgi:hypothetical protein
MKLLLKGQGLEQKRLVHAAIPYGAAMLGTAKLSGLGTEAYLRTLLDRIADPPHQPQ